MSAVRHARKPCNINAECDLRHARLGVQHNNPQPCTVPVQHHGLNLAPPSVQHRTTKVLTYVGNSRCVRGEGQTIPSCTACKTDHSTYRTSRRQPMTYRAMNATTDRARELKNGGRHA